jgi:hypothetical protein
MIYRKFKDKENTRDILAIAVNVKRRGHEKTKKSKGSNIQSSSTRMT